MLVFKERGKPEYPEKNLSEQGTEPATNSTHTWRASTPGFDPGHTGGRRVLSPLHHHCFGVEYDGYKNIRVSVARENELS